MSKNSILPKYNEQSQNLFVCFLCQKTFAHKSSLNRHKKEKNNLDKLKTCKFCGEKRIRLNDHQRRCQLKFFLKNDKINFHSPNTIENKLVNENATLMSEKTQYINNDIFQKKEIHDLKQLLESLSEEKKQIEEMKKYQNIFFIRILK